MENRIKYRVFKVSVNIPFFFRCLDSKVYEKKGRFSLIYPSLTHSLGTIVLGFWGAKVLDSLRALHTNFSGGEDYTFEIDQPRYDDMTNEVWNNLSRSTAEKLDRSIVQSLIELQEKYIDNNKDIFSDNNVYFLLNELKRKRNIKILKDDIQDFFDSLNVVFSKG